MKYLSIVVVLIFSLNVLAQTEEKCPSVKNGKSGISSVTNINSSASKDFSCQIATISGKITGLGYESDESDEVISITIENKDGQRFIVHFGDESLLDCFSEADKRNWKSQIKKGVLVNVKAYACGAAGDGDLQIASITFLNK